MDRSGLSNSEFALRWEEGEVDHRAEHFRLFHRDARGRPAAIVGRRDPVGLIVRFVDDLPPGIVQDLRDELWAWCTPPADDPWFTVDLWHHLAEHAQELEPMSNRIRWELVPRRATPGSEPPFVEDITALFKKWLDQADAAPGDAARAFMRDYVTLFAAGGEPRLIVGRLERFVRLQTGDDPSARFVVHISGPSNQQVPIRVAQLDDLDLADAWVCMPFEALEFTKLSSGRGHKSLRWSHAEVNALLRHIDDSLAAEVACSGLLAEAEGPKLKVRFEL